MGRGRGKGKKLTAFRSHEDPDSGGEEVVPSYKRRGRPQKPLKDDAGEERLGKIEEEEEDDVTTAVPKKEVKSPATPENGKKRRRYPQVKGNESTLLEENGVKGGSDFVDSPRPNGFRQNGSRRKSTPRRAAEVGVECQ